MQSFQAFEKALLSKLMKSAADQGTSGGAEVAELSTADICIEAQPIRSCWGPEPEEVSDAMASIWIEGDVVRFGHLEEAVNR